MFTTAEELLNLCKKRDLKISEIMVEKEAEYENLTEDELLDKLMETWKVMKESATAGVEEEIESVSGLVGGNAKKINEYRKENETLSGDFINLAMARAISTSEVNASMGKIIAAPTAGGAGILPSAMLSAKDKLDLTDDEIVKGLLTSAAIGEIVAINATISGAEGGCQAECGAAAAMAAAGIVELAGGSVQQCFDAAGFALTHVMGLVCDPIAGLVEYPCIVRNSSGVVNAFISADMALANVQAIIPFDEVVGSMFKVGNAMPEALRETALGGLAATETGKAHELRILGHNL